LSKVHFGLKIILTRQRKLMAFTCVTGEDFCTKVIGNATS